MDMSIFEEFILQIDQNKNDKIDYREFIAATIYKKLFSKDQIEKNMQMLEQAFNFFDQDEDGEICKEELAAVIKKDNPEIDDGVLEYMINEVDADGDGKVNFQEFKNMMHNKFEQ